jgi:aminoglycoside/choline kinase family phosphotransferase
MMVDARQMAATQDVLTRIQRYLEETGVSRRSPTLVSLTGDASDRRYVRVLGSDGSSQVLAVHPGPIEFEQMPFASVARLLAAMPVPAPRVLGHSDSLGIIAQQDLGDLTLQAHLESASSAERASRYREAIAIIATLQRRGAELASPEYVPYGLAFDEEKLTFELEFFLTHFVEGHRAASLSTEERSALSDEFRGLARRLAGEPRVVCHRDYHSRNLMLHDGQLHVIDFQDARMGPDTYDLASLLRDSYVDFTEDDVDSLIEWFLTLT